MINKLAHKSYKHGCFEKGSSHQCLSECKIRKMLEHGQLLFANELLYKKVNYSKDFYNLSMFYFSQDNSNVFDNQCDLECGDRVDCIQYYHIIDKRTESDKKVDKWYTEGDKDQIRALD